MPTAPSLVPVPRDHSMLMVALSYARRRWPVFPVDSGSKKPLVSGPRRASVDPAKLTEWWTRWPEAAVATPTGVDGCGFDVIDVDGPEGEATIAAARAAGALTDADVLGVARTARGAHYYIAPLLGRKSPIKHRPGIDIRAAKSYVVLPGSIHGETGRPYVWESEPEGWPEPLESAPAWDRWFFADVAPVRPALALVPDETSAGTEPSPADLAWAIDRRSNRLAEVASAQEGSRRNILNRVAFELGRLVAGRFLPHEDTRQALYTAAKECGLPAAEITTTIERALADAAEDPWKRGYRPEHAAARLPGIIAARDLEPRRWGGQAGGTDFAVLGVLISKAAETGYIRHLLISIRTLALEANVTPRTAQNALTRLIDDGWVARSPRRDTDRRAAAYDLVPPAEDQILPLSSKTLREIHRTMAVIGLPVFTSGKGLGKAAARVFALVDQSADTVWSAKEIAERSGLNAATVREKLRLLAAYELIDSTSDGWRKGRLPEHSVAATLDTLGQQMGATEQVERRIKRIDEWRNHWRQQSIRDARAYSMDQTADALGDAAISDWAEMFDEGAEFAVNTSTGEMIRTA